MPDAHQLLRTGRVVAVIDGEEWSVSEDRNDPATHWFRLRNGSNENRIFLKIGAATPEERRHVRRARKAWAEPRKARFALYTVQAKSVLALAGAKTPMLLLQGCSEVIV